MEVGMIPTHTDLTPALDAPHVDEEMLCDDSYNPDSSPKAAYDGVTDQTHILDRPYVTADDEVATGIYPESITDSSYIYSDDNLALDINLACILNTQHDVLDDELLNDIDPANILNIPYVAIDDGLLDDIHSDNNLHQSLIAANDEVGASNNLASSLDIPKFANNHEQLDDINSANNPHQSVIAANDEMAAGIPSMRSLDTPNVPIGNEQPVDVNSANSPDQSLIQTDDEAGGAIHLTSSLDIPNFAINEELLDDINSANILHQSVIAAIPNFVNNVELLDNINLTKSPHQSLIAADNEMAVGIHPASTLDTLNVTIKDELLDDINSYNNPHQSVIAVNDEVDPAGSLHKSNLAIDNKHVDDTNLLNSLHQPLISADENDKVAAGIYSASGLDIPNTTIDDEMSIYNDATYTRDPRNDAGNDKLVTGNPINILDRQHVQPSVDKPDVATKDKLTPDIVPAYVSKRSKEAIGFKKVSQNLEVRHNAFDQSVTKGLRVDKARAFIIKPDAVRQLLDAMDSNNMSYKNVYLKNPQAIYESRDFVNITRLQLLQDTAAFKEIKPINTDIDATVSNRVKSVKSSERFAEISPPASADGKIQTEINNNTESVNTQNARILKFQIHSPDCIAKRNNKINSEYCIEAQSNQSKTSSIMSTKELTDHLKTVTDVCSETSGPVAANVDSEVDLQSRANKPKYCLVKFKSMDIDLNISTPKSLVTISDIICKKLQVDRAKSLNHNEIDVQANKPQFSDMSNESKPNAIINIQNNDNIVNRETVISGTTMLHKILENESKSHAPVITRNVDSKINVETANESRSTIIKTVAVGNIPVDYETHNENNIHVKCSDEEKDLGNINEFDSEQINVAMYNDARGEENEDDTEMYNDIENNEDYVTEICHEETNTENNMHVFGNENEEGVNNVNQLSSEHDDSYELYYEAEGIEKEVDVEINDENHASETHYQTELSLETLPQKFTANSELFNQPRDCDKEIDSESDSEMQSNQSFFNADICGELQPKEFTENNDIDDNENQGKRAHHKTRTCKLKCKKFKTDIKQKKKTKTYKARNQSGHYKSMAQHKEPEIYKATDNQGAEKNKTFSIVRQSKFKYKSQLNQNEEIVNKFRDTQSIINSASFFANCGTSTSTIAHTENYYEKPIITSETLKKCCSSISSDINNLVRDGNDENVCDNSVSKHNSLDFNQPAHDKAVYDNILVNAELRILATVYHQQASDEISPVPYPVRDGHALACNQFQANVNTCQWVESDARINDSDNPDSDLNHLYPCINAISRAESGRSVIVRGPIQRANMERYPE